MAVRNILIFNPFGIGDVLFTTPLLRNLREHFPHSAITYLCNRRSHPLLENNLFLDKVMVFEKDEWRNLARQSKTKFIRQLTAFYHTIRRQRFDVVFDLSLNSQYGLFFKLSGIPMRIGFNYKKRGRFLTHHMPLPAGYCSQHVARYYLSLLSFLGIVPKEYPFSLTVPDEAEEVICSLLAKQAFSSERPLVVFCPGSGDSWQGTAYYKRWPKEYYLCLARMFLEKQGLQIALCGSKNESDICDYIAGSLSGPVFNLCGSIDLKAFCALVARCEFMVTNDGGPFHIAQALGRKAVVFFGPVDENVYGAYPHERSAIIMKHGVPCRPCYKAFRFSGCDFDKRCLREITPEAVFAAVKNIFRAIYL